MVPSNLAIPDRADEDNCPDAASAQGLILNYFKAQSSSPAAWWRPEPQSQSHHEKILRLPNLSRYRARALSLTWQAAWTWINPWILPRNGFFFL